MERLAFLLGLEATEIPVVNLLERFLPAFLKTLMKTFLPTFLTPLLMPLPAAFGFVAFYERFDEFVGQITFSDHNSSFR